MSPSFYPPQPNPWVIRLTHWLSPLVARLFYRIRLDVAPQDLARLTPLHSQSVLYLVNHPTFHDPIAVMLLSAKLGKGFYYLASIEQFQGILGRYFQRIGSYSVRRGQGDRASIQQTLALLRSPQSHLVIFPEGGCSFQNDHVMPFRPGAIQIAFQAMQRQVRQGEAVPDCFVVPLGLKYLYTDDLSPVINDLLDRLESALNLDPTDSDEYIRLRAIAHQVMHNIAADYGIEMQVTSENWTPVIEQLRLDILERCEAAFELESNPQMPIRERTYQVEAALLNPKLDPTSLSRALIERSIARLFNFNAIFDGYVADNPTSERFLDTLTRLEREVFQIDRPSVKGHRVARMGVGQIINLKESWEEYQRDRNGTIDYLTQMVQDQVQQQIDQLTH